MNQIERLFAMESKAIKRERNLISVILTSLMLIALIFVFRYCWGNAHQTVNPDRKAYITEVPPHPERAPLPPPPPTPYDPPTRRL
jgi:hypothetical protein